jgi:HSP20 family protein
MFKNKEHQMSYIKIRFGNPADHPGNKYQMFQSMNPLFSIQDSWKPQMDIYETEEEIIVTAEISGVKQEDLEIEIDEKAARISGVRKPSLPGKEAKYRLAEIQYGKFDRIIFLPSPIDTDQISASYQNGFLNLKMNKIKLNKFHTIEIEDDK